MEKPKEISVDLVYAQADQQTVLSVTLQLGATIESAINNSGVLDQHPELVLQNLHVGVFGEMRRLSDVVKAGDRIEIYRPLIADPKVKRRERI